MWFGLLLVRTRLVHDTVSYCLVYLPVEVAVNIYRPIVIRTDVSSAYRFRSVSSTEQYAVSNTAIYFHETIISVTDYQVTRSV